MSTLRRVLRGLTVVLPIPLIFGLSSCGNYVAADHVGKAAIATDDNGDILLYVTVCDAAVEKIFAVDEAGRDMAASGSDGGPPLIGEITFTNPRQGSFVVNLSSPTPDNGGQTIQFPADPSAKVWVETIVAEQSYWNPLQEPGIIPSMVVRQQDLMTFPPGTLLTRSASPSDIGNLREITQEEFDRTCATLGRDNQN